MHGIVRGKTVELTEELGVAEGQEVEVEIRLVAKGTGWGDGIRRSAGGWANYPEIDAVMVQIHEDRKRERALAR